MPRRDDSSGLTVRLDLSSHGNGRLRAEPCHGERRGRVGEHNRVAYALPLREADSQRAVERVAGGGRVHDVYGWRRTMPLT